MDQETQEAFCKLGKINSAEPNGMAIAQTILDSLVGKPVNKELVNELKVFLKRRQWGIQYNEVVVAPVWQADRGASSGGYMRYSYYSSHRRHSEQLGSFSRFPAVKLALRPDRRRLESRKKREANDGA